MHASLDSLAATGAELAPEQLASASGGILPVLHLIVSYGVGVVADLID
jgi:hypothetical protein